MKAADTRSDLFPLVVILSGAGIAVVTMTGSLAPVRPLLVLVFLLVCPGLAFVRLLPVENRIIVVTLSVALSLAIDAAVATLLLYTAAWSWSRILFIVFGITMIGALLTPNSHEISQPEIQPARGAENDER